MLILAAMNSTLAVILENVLPVLILILTPFVGALVAFLAALLKKKTGFDIAVAQQKLITGAVEQGIGSAEQWALNQAKAGDAVRPDGAQKLDKALEFIGSATKELGLQEKGRDELVKLIEARLGLAVVKSGE